MDKVSLVERNYSSEFYVGNPLALQMTAALQETFVSITAVLQDKECSNTATPLTNGLHSAAIAGVARTVWLHVGNWDSRTPVSTTTWANYWFAML